MQNEQIRFLLKLLIFTGIISAGIMIWIHFMPEKYVYQHIWALVGFFFLLTILIHQNLLSANRKSPKEFVMRFMIISAVKLFAFLMIIMIYGLIGQKDMPAFALTFVFLYFVYSAFEISALMKHFKNNK